MVAVDELRSPMLRWIFYFVYTFFIILTRDPQVYVSTTLGFQVLWYWI
jgi:hypothetical protein